MSDLPKALREEGLERGSKPATGHSVAVIGAGIVGLSCAWLLSRLGHHVLLVDGSTQGAENPGLPVDPASAAALGVLMGRVFHRSSGRGWRLRQQSLALWRQWRCELAERGRPIPWRSGLLLLAADQEDLARQRALLQDPRRRPDDPADGLQLWERPRLRALWPALPAAALAGLYSPADGQLDPLAAMRALADDGAEAGLMRASGWVTSLRRQRVGWRLQLAGGGALEAEWVVLCAGLGNAALLEDRALPEPLALEPVLGQAFELELDPADSPADDLWPGAVQWRGMNLIARPSAGAATWRLWLGATLEPGQHAAPEALQALRTLGGEAPEWLLRARQRRVWQGLRARPVGQPAPLLRELDDGLLLAGGHYRNGVLLAPASAAWVRERITARR